MAKRYKVKKGPVVVLVVIAAIAIAIVFGVKQYQLYVYHNSTEYKLLEMGYKESDVELMQKKLNKKEFDSLLELKRNEYLADIINQKYFMFKNLNRYLRYKADNKNQENKDIVAIVNVSADRDWYQDAIPTNINDGYSMLVNKFNYLDENYSPDDIEKISNWYAYEGHEIRKDVYGAYKDMWNAAKEDGVTLVVYSSYRTYADQKEVYDTYENSRGEEYADSIAARPGYSEHQSGLALDILEYGLEKSADFVNTKSYKWLLENAYKYGFILRFPEGKEYLTGYKFESWHYRYLGKDLANKVHNEGITYDEYYAFYGVK